MTKRASGTVQIKAEAFSAIPSRDRELWSRLEATYD
jgi:hypothetical protein